MKNNNNSNGAGKNPGNAPASLARFIPNKGMQQQSAVSSDGLYDGQQPTVDIQEPQSADVNDRHNMARVEWFESTINELLVLAKKQPLRNARQLARAKQLMCDLKLMGFSPIEIEELTGRAWKESTIKQYVQGVKATQSNVRDHLVNVIVRVINTGTGLQDVAYIAQLSEKLAGLGVGIEDVANFVALIKQIEERSPRKLDVRGIIEAVETMKRNGVSPDRLHEVLSYVTAVAEHEGRFDPDAVSKVAQASQRFGGLGKVLDAIGAFGKLEEIESKIEEKKGEREEALERLKGCRAELQKAQADLDTYRRLQQKGYDTAYLEKFEELARKYGRGKLMPEQVLEQVVSRYSGVEEIAAKEAELRGKLGEAEAKLRRLQIDHASYARSIDLCHDLLFNYKLSPEVIKRMNKELEVYGGVAGFLDALEKFRSMENLKNKVHALRANITRLRAEEQRLISSTQKWRGDVEDAAGVVRTIAGGVTQQMKRQADLNMQEIRQASLQEIARVKKATAEYAEVLAMSRQFEEELKVARCVTSVLKYPDHAKGLPREYGQAFLRASSAFFRANNINPTARGVPQYLILKYPMLYPLSSVEFSLQDALAWAEYIAASDPAAGGLG